MIRGKSLISFSVSLHIMTSYIWDICYQLCCHSLSNFEPEALPHQCRSSPNPFTSSSSSKVISQEIFTFHFCEKLFLWVVFMFSEKVFLFFREVCYHLRGDLLKSNMLSVFDLLPFIFLIIVPSLWFYPKLCRTFCILSTPHP